MRFLLLLWFALYRSILCGWACLGSLVLHTDGGGPSLSGPLSRSTRKAFWDPGNHKRHGLQHRLQGVEGDAGPWNYYAPSVLLAIKAYEWIGRSERPCSFACLKSNYHQLAVYNAVTPTAAENSIAVTLPFTIKAFNSHHVLFNFPRFKALIAHYSHQDIMCQVLLIFIRKMLSGSGWVCWCEIQGIMSERSHYI